MEKILIKINGKDFSKLYAHKKKFFNDMKEQLKTLNVQVIQDNHVDRGNLVLITEENEKKLSVNEYMIKKYKEGNLSIL